MLIAMRWTKVRGVGMKLTETVVDWRVGVELKMREESTQDMLFWRLRGVEWSGRRRCDVVLSARV
jgi:hypothetical protein